MTPTDRHDRSRPGKARLVKVAAGVAAGAGFLGSTVALAPPAAAHCPGSMSTAGTALGNGWFRSNPQATQNCHGRFDVELSWVQANTYYRARYTDANGTWRAADVNQLNNGQGPFLSSGTQSPWKAMVTNVAGGRKFVVESLTRSQVTAHH